MTDQRSGSRWPAFAIVLLLGVGIGYVAAQPSAGDAGEASEGSVPNTPPKRNAEAQIQRYADSINYNPLGLVSEALDYNDYAKLVIIHVKSVRYTNGYVKDINTYVVVAEFTLAYKVNAADAPPYKNETFKAGDELPKRQTRSFLFLKTEQGWVLQQMLAD